MNILIINTAFDVADYIVVKGSEVFAIKTDSNAKHSESSLVAIDDALSKANLTIRDIDVVAVNLGAGSFTGIRIGVALAKGFMCGNAKLKAIGFNSFQPLKNRLGDAGKIYINANKNDYYICEFDATKDKLAYQTIDNIEIKENELLFDGNYNPTELVNLVNEKIALNEYSQVNELEPIYLKLSQAEEELLKKNKQSN